jgi:prepilin-type N-terminal cleavage/methylation domain-containing protein
MIIPENNKMVYRLRGFTLLEAIIVMLISSLLVLFALAGIRYYSVLFVNIQDRSEVQTDIRMLQNALNDDVRQNEKIEYDEDLIFISYTENVRYQFDDNRIVRIQELISDTFKLKYQEPAIKFSKRVPGLVEEVTIRCVNEDEMFPVNVTKQYPVGLKMQKDF